MSITKKLCRSHLTPRELLIALSEARAAAPLSSPLPACFPPPAASAAAASGAEYLPYRHCNVMLRPLPVQQLQLKLSPVHRLEPDLLCHHLLSAHLEGQQGQWHV